MTIPKCFQIFANDVRLTETDIERLKPIISSWSATTNDIIGAAPESDLEKLIIIELMTLKRSHILERVVNRLCTYRRNDLRAKVEALL